MTKRGFASTNNDSEGKDPLQASEEAAVEEATVEEAAVEGQAPLVSEEPVDEEPVVEEQLKATQEQPVSAQPEPIAQEQAQPEQQEPVLETSAQTEAEAPVAESTESAPNQPAGYKRVTARPADADIKKLNKDGSERKDGFQPKQQRQDRKGYQGGQQETRFSRVDQRILDIKLEDQRYLDLTAQQLAIQSESIMEIDLQEIKFQMSKNIEQEKDNYITEMMVREEFLGENADGRIFCMVDELEAIKKMENAFMKQQIEAQKVGQKKQEGKTPAEVKYEKDQKLKEIFVGYANLKQSHDLDQLKELIPTFDKQNEENKRAIYKSIKIGHAKEMARAELFKDERKDMQKGAKIAECFKNAQSYEVLMKKILPEEFKEELISLKELADRIEAGDEYFEACEEKFAQKISKLEKLQRMLSKHQNLLSTERQQDKSINGLLYNSKKGEEDVMFFKDFKEKQDLLFKIKQAIDKYPDSEISEKDIQIESMNQKAQMEAERHSEQMRNLLRMVAKSEADLKLKLKKLSVGTEKRAAAVADKNVKPDDKIEIRDYDGSIHEKTDLFAERKEFLQLLEQYEIDPTWLKEQQLTLYNKKMEEETTKLFTKAQALENDLLNQEHDNLMKMISKKATSKEMQAYLLGQLRQESFMQDTSGENSVLNDMLMHNVEKMIKEGPTATVDFDSTDFLMKRIEKAEKAKLQYAKPNRTVADELDRSTRQFVPANAGDAQVSQSINNFEALTYQNYVYKQNEKFHEMVVLHQESNDGEGAPEKGYELIHSMTLAKRDAWLNIYNDYLEARAFRREPVESDDEESDYDPLLDVDAEGVEAERQYYRGIRTPEQFYEMFRHWQFTELPRDKYPNLHMIPAQARAIEDARAEALVKGRGPQAMREAPIEVDVGGVLLDLQQKAHDDAVAFQGIARDDIHAPGWDDALDHKELLREVLLDTPRNVAEALDLSSKDEELFAEAHSQLTPEQREDLKKDFDSVETALGDFKKEYGHEAWEQTKLTVEPVMIDGLAIGSQPLLPWEGIADGLYEREDLQLLDDAMVRKIEMHLRDPHLRVERISEQFENNNYAAISEGDNVFNEQVFDIEGYKAWEKEHEWTGLSPKEQQLALLSEQKERQEAIMTSLRARDAQIENILDTQGRMKALRAVADARSAGEDAGVPDTADKLNKRLARVEREVRERLKVEWAAEAEGKDTTENQAYKGPVTRMMEKLEIEQGMQLDGLEDMHPLDPLRVYVENDVFNTEGKFDREKDKYSQIVDTFENGESVGQPAALEQERRMMELAYGYEDFDLSYIVYSNKIPALQYTGFSGHADTLGRLTSAESAAQLEEVAATQELSPEDQTLASLYDPTNPIREQYLRAKYQMFVNKRLREDYAQALLDVKEMLADLNYQRERFERFSENQVKRFATDASPKPAYNFINMEEEVSKQGDLKSPMIKLKDRLEKFDPNSIDVQNYNDELRFQLELSGNSPSPNFEQQFAFITKQMTDNNVKPDAQTRSLLFQKNVLCEELDQANLNLKKINDNMGGSMSLKGGDLEQFFEQSLRRDNFDGLAHLASYIERNHCSIKAWDISKFRSALDFYLNHTFDLNKVLTFTRFYILHANSRLETPEVQEGLSQFKGLEEQQKIGLFQEAFGELEGLVDMNELFNHLVSKIGSRTFIDPKTKQDPMQNLINFFAQPEIQQVSKLSQEGTTFISSEDVAKYMVNHLDGTNAFKQLSELILKHDEGGDDSLVTSTLLAIKSHLATHKALPNSFSTSNVRQLYFSIKSIDLKVGEKTAEYLLFLFKSNGMAAEAIDLCQNYHKMVRGYETENDSKLSEIRNYYMSDSLLDMPLKEAHYNEVLDKAVFETKGVESAAYLASMTKAYLKDGSIEHALKFFEEGIQSRRQQKEDQEEALVKLFDSTFGLDADADKPYDIKTFKQNYLQLMVVREKMKKEVKAVHLLDELLQRCDPKEIENIFLLQIVLKEERALLEQIAEFNSKDFDAIYNHYNSIKELENLDLFVAQFKEALDDGPSTFDLAVAQAEACDPFGSGAEYEGTTSGEEDDEEAKFAKSLQRLEGKIDGPDSNYAIYSELQTIRQRREVLEKSVQHSSKDSLVDLMKFVGEDQVELLGETKDLKETMRILGVSEDEYRDLITFQDDRAFNTHVIEVMKLQKDIDIDLAGDNQKAFLQAFRESYDRLTKESIERKNKILEEQENYPLLLVDQPEAFRKATGFDVERIVDRAIKARDGKLGDRDSQLILEAYKQDLYQNAPGDNDIYDDDIIAKQSYEALVAATGDELTQAVTQRRENSLGFAIETFNKIQGKATPQWFKNKGELILEERPDVPTAADISAAGQDQFDVNNMSGSDVEEILADYKMTSEQFEDSDAEADEIGYVEPGAWGVMSEAQLQAMDMQQEVGHRIKDPKLINRTIDRYNYLLENQNSPIISNLVHLLDYNDGRQMPSFEDYCENKLDKKENALYNKYSKHAEKFQNLTQEVTKMGAAINNMNREIKHIIEEFEVEASQANKFYSKWSDQRDEKVNHVVESQINNLYNQFVTEQGLVPDPSFKQAEDNFGDEELTLEFEQPQQSTLQDHELNQNSLYPKTLSREEKIRMMKQALSLEVGGFKPVDIFNKFYAEDLIVFGMQNNIPEAVRLGENMLGENNESLSFEMAKAVKSYQMNNNMKYQNAIKKTGPINTSSVYNNSRPEGTANSAAYTKTSIVNMDDPYWKEFIKKNYRTQDRYKLPSVMAYDYKEYGILSDLIDMKKLDQNVKEIKQMGL